MSLAKFSLAKFSESLANPKIQKINKHKFIEPKIIPANQKIPKISLANPKMNLAILNILKILKIQKPDRSISILTMLQWIPCFGTILKRKGFVIA